jgi:hypothetical protein
METVSWQNLKNLYKEFSRSYGLGGAQISVNGSGSVYGTWQMEKMYSFYHVLWLIIGKNMI